VFVSELDDKMKPLLHEDDDDSGVVVIAQAAGPNTIDTDVQPGDIIRAINRTQLQSVSQLQVTVRQLKSSDPVVLQIERGGKLQYLGKSCASPSMICPRASLLNSCSKEVQVYVQNKAIRMRTNRLLSELGASDRDFPVRCLRRCNHLVLIALERL